MSIEVNVIIEIKNVFSNPKTLFQKEFKWNIIRSFQSSLHLKDDSVICKDLALIITPTSSERRVFWQCCCKRFGVEYIGYKEVCN
jgi:hypothetical protein